MHLCNTEKGMPTKTVPVGDTLGASAGVQHIVRNNDQPMLLPSAAISPLTK